MYQRIEDREIWPHLLKDKDDLSLRQMSERYGVAASAIVAAFKRQGISRRPAPSGPRSHRRKEAAAARGPANIADQPHAQAPSPRPHSADASILPHWDDLGRVPDAEIAVRAQTSAASVQEFREHHGIPAPAAPRKSGPKETPTVRRSRQIQQALQPYDRLLGRLPDSEIARLSGLTLQAVRHQRQRRNIRAAGKLPRKVIEKILREEGLSQSQAETRTERTKQSKPAAPVGRPKATKAPQEAPPSPATTLTARQAWRVTIGEGPSAKSVIVVAPSFLDAARLADTHADGGRIATVEALGAAIAS